MKKNGKKMGALLALLLAGNIAIVAAVEIIGTILFEPTKKYSSGMNDFFYE